MDHGYFKDRLSAYVDKDLKPEEYRILDEHVESCEECQKLVKELRKLNRFIDEQAELKGEDYWEKSAQRIEQAIGGGEATEITEITPEKEPSKAGWYWKLTGVAASIILLVMIGIHYKDILEISETEPTKTLEIFEGTRQVPPPPIIVDEIEDKSTDHSQQKETPEQEVGRSEVKKAGGRIEPVKTDNSEKPESLISRFQQQEKQKLSAETISRAAQTPSPSAYPSLEPVNVPEPTKKPMTEEEKDKVYREARDTEMLRYDFGETGETIGTDLKGGIDTDNVTNDLAYWQNKRDSLNNYLAAKSKTIKIPGQTSSYLAKTNKDESTDKEAELKAKVEKELLEANYQIYRLSEDTDEKVRAKQYILDVINNPRSENQELAREYLIKISRLE